MSLGKEHLTTILGGQNHESICMMQVVSSYLTKSGQLLKGGTHCILEMKRKMLLTMQVRKCCDCLWRSVFYCSPAQHSPRLLLKMPGTPNTKNFIVFSFYKLLSHQNGKLRVETRPSSEICTRARAQDVDAGTRLVPVSAAGSPPPPS